MIISNMRVEPVRTQITNTQKTNNSLMSTQNIPNFRVCYLDESESKSINADKSESHVCSMENNKSKRVIFNACSLDVSG